MLELNKDNFEAEVLQADGYVFVDFWSQGCEPCKALMPDVHKLAEKYEGKMKFTSLDTTTARRLAIKQRVLGLPTLAVYKGGEKIDEVTIEDATVENVEALFKNSI